MPQTILAAVLIFSIYGLTCHRSLAADESRLVGREVEATALQVAERWGAEVKGRVFDEADVGRAVPRLSENHAGHSLLGRDDATSGEPAGAVDWVDDFHGFAINDAVAVGTEAAVFRVWAEATYAHTSTFTPLVGVGARSAKGVTVTVKEAASRATGRPPVAVEFPARLTPARQFIQSR